MASVQIDNNFMLEIVECDPFSVCVFLFSFEEIAVERKLLRYTFLEVQRVLTCRVHPIVAEV